MVLLRLFLLIFFLAGCDGTDLIPLTDHNQTSNFCPGTRLEDGTCPDREIQCPEGYSKVLANAQLETDLFCVMTFEAKAWNDVNLNNEIDAGEIDDDGCNEPGCSTNDWGNSNHKPVSVAEGGPWRKIKHINAWAECDSLNSESIRADIDNDSAGDGTYALVANSERMAIARSLESVDENWTGEAVGSGCLKRGNIGANYNCASVPASYNNGGPEWGESRNDLARMKLASGEYIWDFSGNIEEFLDWDATDGALTPISLSDRAYVASDGGAINSGREFIDLNVNNNIGDVMDPKTWQANDDTLDSDDGIGTYNSGNSGYGGYGAYSGAWYSQTRGGIYNLSFFFHSGSPGGLAQGFRCVYRP